MVLSRYSFWSESWLLRNVRCVIGTSPRIHPYPPVRALAQGQLQPWRQRGLRRWSRAAMVASSSQRLLSACEAWPLVQDQVVRWAPASSSSSSHRSWLTTGFFELVIQLFRFQFATHALMPFFRYSESVTTSTSQGSFSARKPSIAAVNS